MSRAVVFSAFGGTDVLEIVDVEPPPVGPGQVRVRVETAGIQPFDARFRAGWFNPYIPAEFPQGLGNEFAGVVDEVGAGVTTTSPGDEVIGWVWQAAYADHVVVGADEIVPKPAAMPWPEAGALSASGQTAHTALQELGVDRGDTLLVHAAAGGVGTMAVQLAREWGATVIGTASERNHDYLRDLGAVPVAYGHGLADRVRAAAPGGVDVALDCHGGDEAVQVSVDLVSDRKRIGTLSAYGAANELGIQLIGTKRSTERLAELTDLYTQAKLRVIVDRVYPLDQVAQAHAQVEAGHVRGKVVLAIGD
jgi:enoyl reductase